jgi:hypothetical protein
VAKEGDRVKGFGGDEFFKKGMYAHGAVFLKIATVLAGVLISPLREGASKMWFVGWK